MNDDAHDRPPQAAESTPLVELHRFFRAGFTAADIAEPLVSWDATAEAAEVAARMEALDFDVAGVRIDGAVAGWVRREDLASGRMVEHLRSFFDAEVIASAKPIQRVLARLGTAQRLFVTAFGSVGGIITPADLQKAPVRMWLFGLITLVEDAFTRKIRHHFPGDAWHGMISESRLAIAKRLHEERMRRNQSLDLVDCLQFGDKGTILFKEERIRLELGFPSRTRAKQVMKNLESLRNHLAHSQDIVDDGLDTIVQLSVALDRVLDVVG